MSQAKETKNLKISAEAHKILLLKAGLEDMTISDCATETILKVLKIENQEEFMAIKKLIENKENKNMI